MKRIRAVVVTGHTDAGLTLIELVVAMMVFAVVALGVTYSLLSVLSITNDSRSRQVAANLAAQEVDLARSVADIFTLQDVVKTEAVSGITYRVTRTTDWVTATGIAADCGVGGGTLQYKRINVAVTWPKMVGSTPVRADTVLAPSSKINDPTLGTILVRVKNAGGTGSAGVAVTATPVSGTGAAAITETILQTDAEGCTYILKAKPGTYTVKITRANSVTEKQEPEPGGQTAVVAAGATASAGFAFDFHGTVTANYASNYSSLNPRIPNNLFTSFVSTYGIYLDQASASVASRSFKLHPFTAGYEVLAGKYAAASDGSMGCAAIDPGNWPDGTNPAGKALIAPAAVAVATGPGGSASTSVPMGVVAVKNTKNYAVTLAAESATPVAGTANPGCAVAQTYAFSSIAANTTVVIALPYGAWQLKADGSNPGFSSLSIPIGVTGTEISPGGIITLDPRQVAP